MHFPFGFTYFRAYLYLIKINTMQNVFGVLSNGVHVDVATTEKGVKRYATLNGYDIVTVRYNCGYTAREISQKLNGKWKPIL